MWNVEWLLRNDELWNVECGIWNDEFYFFIGVAEPFVIPNITFKLNRDFVDAQFDGAAGDLDFHLVAHLFVE